MKAHLYYKKGKAMLI